MAKKEIKITVEAGSDLECTTMKNALQALANNINIENLILLGEKSKTIGINFKIQTFKNFI